MPEITPSISKFGGCGEGVDVIGSELLYPVVKKCCSELFGGLGIATAQQVQQRSGGESAQVWAVAFGGIRSQQVWQQVRPHWPGDGIVSVGGPGGDQERPDALMVVVALFGC